MAEISQQKDDAEQQVGQLRTAIYQEKKKTEQKVAQVTQLYEDKTTLQKQIEHLETAAKTNGLERGASFRTAHPSYGVNARKRTRSVRHASRVWRPKKVSYVGATSNLGTASHDADSDCPDDRVILEREEHMKTVYHHIIGLDSFLAAEDAVVLEKQRGHGVRRMQARAQPGDYYEARLAAKALYRRMKVGDRVHIVKGEHSTLVELRFSHDIPSLFRGGDAGVKDIQRHMRLVISKHGWADSDGLDHEETWFNKDTLRCDGA